MSYLTDVLDAVAAKNADQPEYLQSVREVFESMEPVIAAHPEYQANAVLERMAEPDRVIMCRVLWMDDQGKPQVNRGFRVQYNTAIGPYKGGFRFAPNVNLSIMKFLGFEQCYKNALTGLPISGAKGGADFDPKGKSDAEIMRFCQAFMTEMWRHIGPFTDSPAGDIGVGAREIGYLFGQYKKIKNAYEGPAVTGKAPGWGGSLCRKEATGYGIVYYTREMLKDMGETLAGKKVVVSGSGNVALYAAAKATELGGKVMAMSDSNGYVVDEEGIDIPTMIQIKEVERKRITEYVKARPNAKYFEGSKGIWTVPCDIAMPCATQNEVDEEAAKNLIAAGVKVYTEGANMPTTPEGIAAIRGAGIPFAPAKAANAGGVSVSALEMSQNSIRYYWTFEEVDAKLDRIMCDIYKQCKEAAARYGLDGDLVAGANIAGFEKIANAMVAQGW